MKLPQRALTNIDLLKYAQNLPHFRGIFMRNNLPGRPWRNEAGIINLDDAENPGTHWVAYRKVGMHVEYFDSFGNLRPPLEVVRYFAGCDISYNCKKMQKYNTRTCGHWCLRFLYNIL